jgi:hypothetical protein
MTYISIQNMEVVCSSETSVVFRRSALLLISKPRNSLLTQPVFCCRYFAEFSFKLKRNVSVRYLYQNAVSNSDSTQSINCIRVE